MVHLNKTLPAAGLGTKAISRFLGDTYPAVIPEGPLQMGDGRYCHVECEQATQ